MVREGQMKVEGEGVQRDLRNINIGSEEPSTNN